MPHQIFLLFAQYTQDSNILYSYHILIAIHISKHICNKCHPFCSCSICGGFLPNFCSGVGKCRDGICGGDDMTVNPFSISDPLFLIQSQAVFMKFSCSLRPSFTNHLVLFCGGRIIYHPLLVYYFGGSRENTLSHVHERQTFCFISCDEIVQQKVKEVVCYLLKDVTSSFTVSKFMAIMSFPKITEQH